MKSTEWGKEFVQSEDFAIFAVKAVQRYHRAFGYNAFSNELALAHVAELAAGALITTGPDSNQDFLGEDRPDLLRFMVENTEEIETAVAFAIAYAHTLKAQQGIVTAAEA